MRLEGLRIRGPVQSRPNWVLALDSADAESRTAWSAYADALLGPAGPAPLITSQPGVDAATRVSV